MLYYCCTSTDIHFTYTEDQYRHASEDVGTIIVNVTSRATEDREAYFDFYYYYYYYYRGEYEKHHNNNIIHAYFMSVGEHC